MVTQDQHIDQLVTICTHKLQTIDSLQLAHTTRTILQNLLQQDHITITNHNDLLAIPQAVIDSTPGHTAATTLNDINSSGAYRLLQLLSQLIIAEHYSELTNLYNSLHHDEQQSLALTIHPCIESSTGSIDFVLCNGEETQTMRQTLDATDHTLTGLLNEAYPLPDRPRSIPTSRVLKDLILLDDHDLETVETYSSSHHEIILTDLLNHLNSIFALNRGGWSPILQLQSDVMLLVISQCQYDHKTPLTSIQPQSGSAKSRIDLTSWSFPDTSSQITIRGIFLEPILFAAQIILPASPHKDLTSSKVKLSSNTDAIPDSQIDAIPTLDSLIILHPGDYKFVGPDILSNPDLNVIFSWLSMSGLDPQTLDNRLDSLNNKTGLLTKTLCNWSYESLPILENKVLFRNAAQKSREPGHDDLFKNIIMNENNFYTEQINNNDQFAASRSRMRFGADIDSALTNGYSILFSENEDTPTPSSISELEARVVKLRNSDDDGNGVSSRDGLIQLLHNVYLAPCGYDSYRSIINHWEPGDLDIVDVTLVVVVKMFFTEAMGRALAEFIPFEVVDKLTDLAVNVCYDWYDSGTKEISKKLFHKDLESDALFYEIHEALASTPSGLELTEAFKKIDGVVWRYIKDLLTMGICTAPNGMPMDFARENLIIEFQNRLNDAILDV